jgi:hypothetical protein
MPIPNAIINTDTASCGTIVASASFEQTVQFIDK